MKKSLMKKWVKALRSGEYIQGTNRLKYYDSDTENYKYCCLGVLCEISGIEIEDYDSIIYENYQKRLGFKSCGGTLYNLYKDKRGNYQTDLASLNDEGLSFKQIANIIEKNWEDL